MNKELRTDSIQGEIIHEYDGIEEADNRLPTWWLWTFYGTIAFAVFYWFYYHEFGVGKLPMDVYTAERQQAAMAGGNGPTPELLASLAADSNAVNAGKAIFAQQCVACHDQKGQGKIGPNLTDAHWIHGGGPLDIHKVIDEGIAAKGMPAWGPVLGSLGVQQATAFVLSIRNTNVPGKEPQGEVWQQGGGEPAAAVSDGGVQDAELVDGGPVAQ